MAALCCNVLNNLVVPEFFFDEFAEFWFQLDYPGGQGLWNNLPVTCVVFLHVKNNPVSAVVAHVYCGKSLFAPIGFSEVKFPHAAIGLQHSGKLYIFDESDLHTWVLINVYCNFCAENVGGEMVNGERSIVNSQ
jgi:hypothetical protein